MARSLLRRSGGALACVALLGVSGAGRLLAHGGMVASSPAAGAALGDTPTHVQLTFSEAPESTLSTIRVLDSAGVPQEADRPQRVPGDALSIAVRVRPLGQGIYTVNWRAVSAVDGHATTGVFAFGVRAAPDGAAEQTSASTPVSPLEVAARLTFLLGIILVIGAAAAVAWQFGASGSLAMAAVGWIAAVAGVLLLAEAQRRNAGAALAALLQTPVGRALAWRAAALAVAGAALAAASYRPGLRRLMLPVAGLAAAAAVAVHSASGHAAAREWRSTAIAGQWAHIVAAGVWIGGLCGLLLGVRGAASDAKAERVRRFSRVAVWGLIVVMGTGVVRSVQELTSWRELTSTPYGLLILAKTGLLLMVAAFGALNRWRGVGAAVLDLTPLRRYGLAELVLSSVAIGAAAALGTLPTPAALAVPVGLEVSGADFGTTVRARLTMTSAQPGPNRCAVRIVDYDSSATLRPRRVSVRFMSRDEPDLAPTTLALAPAADGTFQGAGPNLAFDGRWRLSVLVEQESGSVDVPLDVETRIPAQFVSVIRAPGQTPEYTVEVSRLGHVEFLPKHERTGPNVVRVTFLDILREQRATAQVTITAASGGEPPRELPLRRLEQGRYAADLQLQPGPNRLTATARVVNGPRMRATVTITLPGGN